MTDHADHTWALVLAAGDGTRLRSLTTDPTGVSIPKQFCSLDGRTTLLGGALARAERVAPPRRTVVVVAAQHERWWRPQLVAPRGKAARPTLPADNIVVQPENRGTAVGILLPLLTILRRDPLARVVVLPSDHFVDREDMFGVALDTAVRALDRLPRELVLLGLEAESADPDLGWITLAESPPEVAAAPGGVLQAVERFVEKPDPAVAGALRTAGALWNSFAFAVRGQALLRLFEDCQPQLLAALSAVFDQRPMTMSAVVEAYRRMPSADFSRLILEASTRHLRVLRVPACGWSDLGTPERVAACAARAGLNAGPRHADRPATGNSWWNLALALGPA